MLLLGIETSCDDTAMGIVESSGGRTRPQFHVLANIISSQVNVHAEFGGVVPTLAAREHAKNMTPVLKQALAKAKCTLQDIDLLSVTTHPGLVPALLVGIHGARALAWAHKKPILGINHLEGHVVANLLTKQRIIYPAIALIVSGGHTQLVLLKSLLDAKVIGETRDDAAGEAFDKVAKLLGLPFPGGPPIEQHAKHGNPEAFVFPRPMLHAKNFDFSFSGLKTAVLYTVRDLEKEKREIPVNDIAASFQAAVVNTLIGKTLRAASQYSAKTVLLGGGVSANQTLCNTLAIHAKTLKPAPRVLVPEKQFALDNGAMIAAAAYMRWHTLSPTQRTRATWKTVALKTA